MKLEDFPPNWKKKYHPGGESNENFYLQKNNDGIDVYACGTKNGFTTEFFLKMDSKLVFGLAILASAFPFSEKLSGILVMAVLDIGKIPRSIP